MGPHPRGSALSALPVRLDGNVWSPVQVYDLVST